MNLIYVLCHFQIHKVQEEITEIELKNKFKKSREVKLIHMNNHIMTLINSIKILISILY